MDGFVIFYQFSNLLPSLYTHPAPLNKSSVCLFEQLFLIPVIQKMLHIIKYDDSFYRYENKIPTNEVN